MSIFFNFSQRPVKERLGDILINSGEIEASDLKKALAAQLQHSNPLGQILLQQNSTNSWSLETALCTQLQQKYSGKRYLALGQILNETSSLSRYQLRVALNEQNHTKQKLGQILLKKAWIKVSTLKQSLRLQKRFARRSVGVFLALTSIVSCKPPTVPFQNPTVFSDIRIAAANNMYNQVLKGDFRTLKLSDGRIRIYQNGSKVLENVPFFRQGRDNTCGQAVIAMLAQYWGIPQDYQKLVNQENPLNLATSAIALRDSLRQKGISAQDFRQGSLNVLMAEVNQGRPVPVLLDFGSLQTAHYVVVVGYNIKRNTIIVHDSIEGPYVEMAVPQFSKMWENKAVRAILPVAGDNYQRLMFTVFRPDSPLL